MEIKIRKEDVEIYSKGSINTVFKVICNNAGRFIKRVKQKDTYLHYLCQTAGINHDDAIVFSEGEYIGSSPKDIEYEDVVLTL